jgi:RNA polymerase sigma-70 factor, ECF subfamily
MPSLLEAARSGDEAAFAELVAPHRAELHAHCYRMLGSLHDAEDAHQDAMLRAWRGIARFDGRSSLRSWLYRIATNTSLDVIGRRPKRVLPLDYGPPGDPHEPAGMPLAETVWIEPYPDDQLGIEQRESVELAFTAALQHLPPNQRAVLIMREVLGFSAQEVSDALETSVASVNSALQRARQTVDERLPERSQQETLRELGDERVTDIVEAYMDALGRGDIPAVVELLAEDAAWSMPPLSSWYRGLDALRLFLRGGPLSGHFRWTHRAARASGQQAVGTYTWHPEAGCFLPFSLDVLTLGADERVREVTAFIARSPEGRSADELARFPDTAPDPAKVEAIFARNGLPVRLG